jgi:hypothetical protein
MMKKTPRMLMGGVEHMATLMLTQLRDVLDSFARHDVARRSKFGYGIRKSASSHELIQRAAR